MFTAILPVIVRALPAIKVAGAAGAKIVIAGNVISTAIVVTAAGYHVGRGAVKAARYLTHETARLAHDGMYRVEAHYKAKRITKALETLDEVLEEFEAFHSVPV